MTTITLYSTTNPTRPISDEYQAIETSAGKVWIRAYVRSGPDNDVLKALDKASPYKGEVVLNTIEAPTV